MHDFYVDIYIYMHNVDIYIRYFSHRLTNLNRMYTATDKNRNKILCLPFFFLYSIAFQKVYLYESVDKKTDNQISMHYISTSGSVYVS